MLGYFPEHLAQLAARFIEKEKRYGSYLAERWEWSDNELQELLSDVLIKGTHSRPIVIFIDALDECGEGPAKSLLAYFKDLTHQAEHSSARFKVCLSSRHYPILALDTIPGVQVEKMNYKDIRRYTQQRLKDVQLGSKREQIETEILSKSDGGFQWVFLVTETIIDKNLKGIRADKLLEELAYCPQTLSAMYERILNDVSAADRLRMVKLFQWVLFAERPLSAQELRDALATDQDISYTSILDLRAHEGWSDTLAGFERYVKYISRGMIYFQSRELWEQYMPGGEDSDLEAQLIHQSVADYLLDKFLGNPSDRWPPSWSQAGASHFRISRSCLRYITIEGVLEAAQLPRGILSSRFPLAPYAVRFLFAHIQKAEEEGVHQSDLLSALQWAPKSLTIHKLETFWRTLDPEYAHTPIGWPFIEATALHVLVAFGSLSAVRLFFEANNNDINGRDASANTPLMLAIREGHRNIALALLETPTRGQHGHTEHMVDSQHKVITQLRAIDVNAQNKDGDTALDIALDHKMDDVISRLIEAGASLKYLGRETALVAYAISTRNLKLLSIAIENELDLDGAVFFALKDRTSGQDLVLKDIILQLLEAGAGTAKSLEYQSRADPDLEEYQDDEDDEFYDNDALMIAARRGLTDIVSLLLSYNTPRNPHNEFGQSPLLIATENEDEGVLRCLLQNDPSTVEIADEGGFTALDAAREMDQLDMVKILVEMGKFSTNEVLEEIFLEAASYGSAELVKTILQKGSVSAGFKDINGRTALELAAVAGHGTIVELLVNTGKVDVDSKDEVGRTPLSLAAQNGHEAAVKMLLDIDKVDVDSKDQDGRTPLSIAAYNGNEAVVKMLLNKGADLESKDKDGQTPLSWAAENGHEAVVKLLLDTGKVDVDSKDQAGRTPLSWAARNGNEAAVKMLLDIDKVDVDSKDQDGRTPLLLSAYNRRKEVTELLLDTGKVDVDSKDQSGWTPLLLAAWDGDETVVKLLLNTGKVNVNSKNQSGWTPLSLAAQKGYEAVVKMLLDTGKVTINSKDQFGRTPLSWAV